MSVWVIHGRQSDEAASLQLIRMQLKPGVNDSNTQSEEQGEEALQHTPEKKKMLLGK